MIQIDVNANACLAFCKFSSIAVGQELLVFAGFQGNKCCSQQRSVICPLFSQADGNQCQNTLLHP